jgi:hypothetical protein
MSKDVKIFNACNHIIDKKIYESETCPRCYGKGYYYDIHFNRLGDAVLINGPLKLQQEMVKILLDKKNGNEFHKNWGSQVDQMIGSKNININKSKLEVMIRKSLDYLKNLQVEEFLRNNELTSEEILDKILFVNIMPINKTEYNVEVIISNSAKEMLSQTFVM